MKRIALAGFKHETNTFSPIPTGYDDFARKEGLIPGILTGNEIVSYVKEQTNSAVKGFMEAAEPLDYEVVPLVWCEAQPANQMPARVFDQILTLITDAIAAEGAFDGVFLDLHGAMVYNGYQDGETQILQAVREIVGDIPIVVALDLHGNIAVKSFDLASAMVGCRTFPHVDLYETGQRCAHVLEHLLQNRPFFKSFRHLPFLMPTSAQSTFVEPARSLYALLEEMELRPALVSVTLMEGFTAADVPHMGPAVMAYGVTQRAADAAADQLAAAVQARELEFKPNLTGIEEAVQQAIEKAKTADKPVILADVQDNAGGGASSDSTWLLEALVKQQVEDAALGLMYDPAAAQIAHAAGVGAQVSLGLGGKLCPGYHPFRSTFSVEQLYEGEFVCTGPLAKGLVLNLGKMAQLKVGGVRVVVSSARVQAADQSLFRVVGIEPRDVQILVLKSASHFRADFEPISSAIIAVEAPGAEFDDPSKVRYRNLRDGVRLYGGGPVHHRLEP